MEMMVVLTVIAMMAAAGSIGVGRLLRDQRFRSSVARVEELLQIAQDAMLLYGVDVEVEFRNQPKGVQIQLHGDKAVPPPLSRYFSVGYLVQGIPSAKFVDAEGEVSKDEITLHFYSPGSALSRGMLYLGSPEKGPWNTIPLLGYPHRFFAGKLRELPPDENEGQELSATLYPEEVPDGAL
jgi:type II secretory pathway pseudopilin PulG